MTTAVVVASASLWLAAQQVSPPRDASPATPKGSGIIRGRVVAAEGEKPLERTRVWVSGSASRIEPVNTDTDGRYEITNLPAGRYTVSAARGGYLTLVYGQRRPLEMGRPLQLADGEIVDGVDIALPKASVISGRIVDETGEAMANVTVAPMRVQYFEGRRQLTFASYLFRTDDTGSFRLTGLAPGEYVVMASSRETWVDPDLKQTLAYAPTYYPGTANATEAQRIKVDLGQESRGIDFALFPSRAATISGVALDPQGRPAGGVIVSLGQSFRSPRNPGLGGYGLDDQKTQPDGTFRIRNVPPGEYTIDFRMPKTTDAPEAVAQMTVAVSGADVDGLMLAANPPGSLTGRIVTDTGEPPPIPRERLQVAAAPVNRAPMFIVASEQGAVRADYSFRLTGLRDRQMISVWLPDGWALKAILAGGSDYTETPIDFSTGVQLADVQVVITKKLTSLTGRVVDERGRPISDATILAFGAAPEKWGERSRYIKTARPDQRGEFAIKGLPAGQYFVVAVDYLEETQAWDPEFLAELRPSATAFTLEEAGTKELSLNVRKP